MRTTGVVRCGQDVLGAIGSLMVVTHWIAAAMATGAPTRQPTAVVSARLRTARSSAVADPGGSGLSCGCGLLSGQRPRRGGASAIAKSRPPSMARFLWNWIRCMLRAAGSSTAQNPWPARVVGTREAARIAADILG